MNWTEPKSPTEGESYYDHTKLKTPIGEFIIEWKSWKYNDSYSITLNENEYIGNESSLEEAKEVVKDYLINKTEELNKFLGL